MLSVLVRHCLENGGIFYRLDKLAGVALGVSVLLGGEYGRKIASANGSAHSETSTNVSKMGRRSGNFSPRSPVITSQL